MAKTHKNPEKGRGARNQSPQNQPGVLSPPTLSFSGPTPIRPVTGNGRNSGLPDVKEIIESPPMADFEQLALTAFSCLNGGNLADFEKAMFAFRAASPSRKELAHFRNVYNSAFQRDLAIDAFMAYAQGGGGESMFWFADQLDKLAKEKPPVPKAIPKTKPMKPKKEVQNTSLSGGGKLSDADYQIGLEMLQENKYKRGYCGLPFHFKGVDYKPGDVMPTEAATGVYGNAKGPTWCNLFLMDFGRSTHKSDPFAGLGSRIANANTLCDFWEVQAADENGHYTEITSLPDAWKECNKGEYVVLAWKNPKGGSGHVATAYPTPIEKLKSRSYGTQELVFGQIIQAGATDSDGPIWLNAGFGKQKISQMKAYKYNGN